jgi:hypothetical protein
VREQLLASPEYVARKTGIPEVAGLRYLPLPQKALKIVDMIEVYRQQNHRSIADDQTHGKPLRLHFIARQ